MRADETGNPPGGRGIGAIWIPQRVEIRDVEFVRSSFDFTYTTIRYSTLAFFRPLDEAVYVTVREIVLSRAQADTVVGSEEVEKSCVPGRRFKLSSRGSQASSITGSKGVQYKRGQGELIYEVCFIVSVTKVRDILTMRDVCLSD